MSMTLEEVKEKLKQFDEVTLLEIFDITSEELVERFSDLIEEREEYFIKEIELEEFDTFENQ